MCHEVVAVLIFQSDIAARTSDPLPASPQWGEGPRRRRVGGGFLPETNIQANRMVLKRGFASQEGRKGGELYTPRSVLRFNVGGRRHEIETDV